MVFVHFHFDRPTGEEVLTLSMSVFSNYRDLLFTVTVKVRATTWRERLNERCQCCRGNNRRRISDISSCLVVPARIMSHPGGLTDNIYGLNFEVLLSTSIQNRSRNHRVLKKHVYQTQTRTDFETQKTLEHPVRAKKQWRVENNRIHQGFRRSGDAII